MLDLDGKIISASFLDDTLIVVCGDEEVELEGQKAVVAKTYLESKGIKIQDGNLADDIL